MLHQIPLPVISFHATFSPILLLFVDCRLDDNCRSALQESTVQLGLDMFALLAAECTALLRKDLITCVGASMMMNDNDLHAILPCVKVWSDWMICHESLWNPPPLPLDPELG